MILYSLGWVSRHGTGTDIEHGFDVFRIGKVGAVAAALWLGACGGAVATSSQADSSGSDSSSGSLIGEGAGMGATTGGQPSATGMSTGAAATTTGYSTTGTASGQGAAATRIGVTGNAKCGQIPQPVPVAPDAVPLTNAIVINDGDIADHTGWVFMGTIGPSPKLTDFIVGVPSPTCASPFGDPATTCSEQSAILSLGFPAPYPTFGNFPGPGLDMNIVERDACGRPAAGISNGKYPCPGVFQILSVTDTTIDFQIGGLEQYGEPQLNGYYRAKRCPPISP